MNPIDDDLFATLFAAALGEGKTPFPYQARLAAEPWPDLLDIPTGLGKTAAVGVAFLYKHLRADPHTPQRLVWCLPMRSLVEQTFACLSAWVAKAAPLFEAHGRALPGVHLMMGGAVDAAWAQSPEGPGILVGTQDMLLSRALNRGYAMSRFQWPIHFAWLHNDALWVFDEVQLMGVGLETSAQLEGLRRALGTLRPARSLWVSATLDPARLSTVDHRPPPGGRARLTLGEGDRVSPEVRRRVHARKRLSAIPGLSPSSSRKAYAGWIEATAQAILDRHVPETLTLVVVNRVSRAQDLYRALLKAGRPPEGTGLVHARFRPGDRARQSALLKGEGDRILVSTQAIEAGVDVSARTLFTELAPWPSLVQRFGRCNRGGEWADADLYVLELDEGDADLCLPYTPEALSEARGLLQALQAAGGQGSPEALGALPHTPAREIRPILRRRDLLALFDTTPDLAGADLDVSRFIRDGDDTDVQVFWRPLQERPDPDAPPPEAEELCRVSIAAFRTFLKGLSKAGGAVWRWDALEGRWFSPRDARPGQTFLLDPRWGGYDPDLGWTGEVGAGAPAPVKLGSEEGPPQASMGGDPDTYQDAWVTLEDHLRHVADAARRLVDALDLPPALGDAVVDAAAYHDVGKAHPVFQGMLLSTLAPEDRAGFEGATWAKSAGRGGRGARPHFRHELASALRFLQGLPAQGAGEEDGRAGHPEGDLVAYLIAAHHGKVRLSIRALPGERVPPTGPGGEAAPAFARGIWAGDAMPPEDRAPLRIPEGPALGSLPLDLSPMGLGAGCWSERVLRLRDRPDLGPFVLSYLEALVRVADARASRDESLEVSR